MKYNELYKKLKDAGCTLLRHGKSHDIWMNPANGTSVAVPRHGTREVPPGTLNSIYQRLGL
ncbi:MAG: type II toxin-antitoxin system HicA family toxin [Prevotella sp.]|nr:type II toxin-antitoxin system HicA family toxin [Prevotella sp.]